MVLYLIAIVPPASINDSVLGFKNHMLTHYGCKVALKSPAHITLVPPFKMPFNDEARLRECLCEWTAGFPDFTITLKNFSSFPPRVIFINICPNPPLQELKKELEQFLLQHSFGIKKENRPYHPHMTIANRDLEKEDYAHAWQFFNAKNYEAAFPASAITLLRHNGSTWDVHFQAPLAKNNS